MSDPQDTAETLDDEATGIDEEDIPRPSDDDDDLVGHLIDPADDNDDPHLIDDEAAAIADRDPDESDLSAEEAAIHYTADPSFDEDDGYVQE